MKTDMDKYANAVVTVDFAIMKYEEILRVERERKPPSSLDVAIDNVTGYNHSAKVLEDLAACLRDMIRGRKIMGQPHVRESEELAEITAALKKFRKSKNAG